MKSIISLYRTARSFTVATNGVRLTPSSTARRARSGISILSVLVFAAFMFAGADSAFAAKPAPGDAVAGEALYLQKCRMCHGVDSAGGFAQRDIHNAGVARLTGAIRRRADMNFLAYLTDQNISDITAYLDTIPAGIEDDLPPDGDVVAGEAAYRDTCTYCHTYGKSGRPGAGPDLQGVTSRLSAAYLGAWVGYPAEMIAAGAYPDLPSYRYNMPDMGHLDMEVLGVVSFLAGKDDSGELIPETPPKELTEAEFDAASANYFNRCAGCHGLYRTGATGPNITEVASVEIGTDGLRAIMRYGTPGGMPNFGTSGLMTEAQIEDMAAFLQLPPPTAPEWTMPEIEATHSLIVPVAERPCATCEPANNWRNYTGVILRDAGEVSIIDATTHTEVVRLNTGFAVHILRSSASGRYFYAVGRDGLVTLIDLWYDIPKTVATVKGCIDARSIDGSKHDGSASGGTDYRDVFVIEGCYWPPQYVTFDGLTLAPINLVDLRTPAGPGGTMTDIYGDLIVENRVAAIAAAHDKPFWMLALKESGYVAIVDYTVAGHGIATQFATEKFLHDGGFDNTGRYFLVAANASEKMVVIDLGTETIEPSYVGSFFTGNRPHPGRGANWFDPVYGWVNATTHISEGLMTVYGTDPANRSDVAWQVVREFRDPAGLVLHPEDYPGVPAAGSLFLKTHPLSPWVLIDVTLSADYGQMICSYNKEAAAFQAAPGRTDACFQVAINGKAVHMEFNAAGTQVWVSDWAIDGGVVILDAITLQQLNTIYAADTPSNTFKTPTGKFNVTNTAEDIY